MSGHDVEAIKAMYASYPNILKYIAHFSAGSDPSLEFARVHGLGKFQELTSAFRDRYAGYPGIIEFIEIQAFVGNEELLQRLRRVHPNQVAELFKMSLDDLNNLAKSQVEAMYRGQC